VRGRAGRRAHDLPEDSGALSFRFHSFPRSPHRGGSRLRADVCRVWVRCVRRRPELPIGQLVEAVRLPGGASLGHKGHRLRIVTATEEDRASGNPADWHSDLPRLRGDCSRCHSSSARASGSVDDTGGAPSGSWAVPRWVRSSGSFRRSHQGSRDGPTIRGTVSLLLPPGTLAHPRRTFRAPRVLATRRSGN
jgi:hypothetical protein